MEGCSPSTHNAANIDGGSPNTLGGNRLARD